MPPTPAPKLYHRVRCTWTGCDAEWAEDRDRPTLPRLCPDCRARAERIAEMARRMGPAESMRVCRVVMQDR